MKWCLAVSAVDYCIFPGHSTPVSVYRVFWLLLLFLAAGIRRQLKPALDYLRDGEYPGTS